MKIPRALQNSARQLSTAKIGVILIIILVVSLMLYALRPAKKLKQTLFFPETVQSRLSREVIISGETRFLPSLPRIEDKIDLLVEDLILGAMRPEHSRLISRNVKLLSLVHQRGIVYLNLSADLLDDYSATSIPLELQVQVLANTVLFNFPGLKKIYIFIDGQIPDFSAIYGQERFDFSDGVTFSSDVLR